VEVRKAELQEVLEKERTFQREPFEGGRVAKEQKQVQEEHCRAEVAQGSAEIVVAEVEANWTVAAEQPVIDMIQFKGGEQGRASSGDSKSEEHMWEAQLGGQQEGAASKKVWIFVKPGAEELKEAR